MSTVLLCNGKLYADSQGTDTDTGVKDLQTNKLFKIGHKRYGVTGSLAGWEMFKGIHFGWNLVDRLAWWFAAFPKFRVNIYKTYIICVDDKKDKVYIYDQRWYGWKKRKYSVYNLPHASMGSGTEYFDAVDRKLFFEDNLSPEYLITKAMRLDKYSGGRIVIM